MVEKRKIIELRQISDIYVYIYMYKLLNKVKGKTWLIPILTVNNFSYKCDIT